MALSHQIGKASQKSAAEMAAELAEAKKTGGPVERKVAIAPKAHGSMEFYEKGNLDAPVVKVDLVGKPKQWGVRIDEAIHELVKRNSKNQTEDAEKMILLYAAKMGWE